LKILAIHGLWGKSSVFNSFRRYFGADEFFAPDIDWGENYIKVLEAYIKKLKPDVIIGYSYGGYAVQQLFGKNPNTAKMCVLIAPIGPKGISVKGILGCLKANGNPRKKKIFPEKFSTLMRIFPGVGNVRNPIGVPVLVVSGGEDRFISLADAEKTACFHHKANHYHYFSDGHRELASDIVVIRDIRNWINLDN